MKELKIGDLVKVPISNLDTFLYIEVVESEESCKPCFFNAHFDCPCKCNKDIREDSKHIIYQEITEGEFKRKSLTQHIASWPTV